MSRSFSDINTYLRCGQKYYYRVVRNLQPKKKNMVLHQGTAMHRMLMAGFLAMRRGDLFSVHIAVETEFKLLLEEAGDVQLDDDFIDIEKMLDDSLHIVLGYFHQADWEGWEILHVEEQFEVTIDGETITFTPDLVARDRRGDVWIFDHKSTSSVPRGGIPFASQQSLLYYACVRAFYPECKGFYFNYLRKKRPTMPRLNKTKPLAVTDLNRVDTTFEILYAFIGENAPELFANDAHKRRLAELRDQPNRFYYTERVLANDSALTTVVKEALVTIGNINRDEEAGTFVRNLQEDRGYLSCSKCPYQRLCEAEMLDYNTSMILEDYEPRDEKNPYEPEDHDGED